MQRTPLIAGTVERRPWLFIVPLAAVLWGARIDAPQTGLFLGLVLVLTVGSGALWQVGARRDLVDRLTPAAVVFMVAAPLLFFGVRGSGLVSSLGAGTALAGVLSGLVLAEAAIRHAAGRLRGRAFLDAATARSDHPAGR